MLTTLYSAVVRGIDALPVTIECLVEKGVKFYIVGLPDTAIKESQQRILAAMKASEIPFPHKRTVINLAPADIKKEGAGFDLPITIGILASAGVIERAAVENTMIAGELSLSGRVLPVRGALPIAIKAREMGVKRLIIPRDNATEAAIVNNLEVIGVGTLRDTVEFLNGKTPIEPTVVNTREEFARDYEKFDKDFSDVRGQEAVKRALEVACAGGHNVIMVGPPGSGKSMMAERIPSILPPLTLHEALDTTKIHSVAGSLARESRLMTRRPFRQPHHTVSPVALVGGGANPHPGEISLAHNGVLFLDEFPEFPRTVLEVLRQPMEDRVISISRAKYSVRYPASFMLVAAMNPCPCGYYGHPTRKCSCLPTQVRKYMGRISGPLIDRIDIQVAIHPVDIESLSDRKPGEPSKNIRERVMAARDIQTARFRDFPEIHCNAQMTSAMLRRFAWPAPEALEKLKTHMNRLQLSARAFDRILRVARTIADLDGSHDISIRHIAEAISYRILDRDNYLPAY